MKKLLLLISAIAPLSLFSQACSELFFSEYLEGTSNNKAIEVYNASPNTVNLADYKIYRYNNGSPTPSDSLHMQGMLAPGAVYVAGNPSALSSILSVSDTLHTITFFNGDDAMSLKNLVSGIVLDIIGVIGTDPGTNWSVGAGATSEFTLVRMIGIQQGNTNWAVASTEYDVHPQNTFSFLGSHSMTPCCPTVLASVQSSSDVTCFGGADGMATVQVTGGTTFAYSWLPSGGTAATATGLIAGTYTCIITNECSFADTVTAVINEPAALAASTAFSIPAGCNLSDGSLSVSVGGGTLGYAYLWSNGDTTATADSLAAGAYTCTITDANNCTVVLTDSVTNPAPPVVTLSLLPPDTMCLGSAAITLGGESPSGGTWGGPGVSGNQFDPSATSPGWNLINYFYTDANNCSAMATDSIFTDVCTDILSANSTPGPEVYPNPASEMLTLEWRGTPAASIELLDAAGRLLRQSNCNSSANTIDVSALENGVYFLRTRDEQGNAIRHYRFVKK